MLQTEFVANESGRSSVLLVDDHALLRMGVASAITPT
jgi:hypothetical protein